jgi:hypothetical protein
MYLITIYLWIYVNQIKRASKEYSALQTFLLDGMAIQKKRTHMVLTKPLQSAFYSVPCGNRTHIRRLGGASYGCTSQARKDHICLDLSRIFSVPYHVPVNPCYVLFIPVSLFLMADCWHLPPLGERLAVHSKS